MRPIYGVFSTKIILPRHNDLYCSVRNFGHLSRQKLTFSRFILNLDSDKSVILTNRVGQVIPATRM